MAVRAAETPPKSAPPGPSASAAPVSSVVAPARTAPLFDTPAWPDATKQISLTWAVHPASEVKGTSYYGRHIDLVARAGQVTRVIPIDATISITWGIDMQDQCRGGSYGNASTVAELYMNGGGNLWYTAERRDDGALDVFENTSTDGLCTDDRGREEPCPIGRKLVGTLEAPVGARFTERFVEVEREETDGGKPGRIREVPVACH